MAAPLGTALLGVNPSQRALYLRNSRRTGRLEVVQVLIEQSYDLLQRDPAKAVDVADAAFEAADQVLLDPALEHLRFDLRADALACKADGERVLGHLVVAEGLLANGLESARSGSGDPLVLARLRRGLGSLRRDQRRLEESKDELRSAIRTFARYGDPHITAKMLLTLAGTHYMAGEPTAALDATIEAGALLDVDREPMVNLGLLHSQVLYLSDLGDYRTALQLLFSFAHIYSQLGADLLEVRGRWMLGRLFTSIERWKDAIEVLEPVRRELLRREMTFDAALAGLDLGLAHAGARQPLAVRKLAVEMGEVFFHENVPREAYATFALFVKAADTLEAGLPQLRRFVAELEPLRRCPPRPRSEG